MKVSLRSSNSTIKWFLSLKSPDSTKELVVRGAYWVTAGFAVMQLSGILANLALAFLLFPEAFGIMAIVQVVLKGLEMFIDVGIGPSIVQNERGDDPEFLNTAWTIQVIRGFGLWAICCLLSTPLSVFYNAPLLASILPVSGLRAVFGGFRSTAFFSSNRALKIGRVTVVELISRLTGIVTMVVIALIYETVWCLVAGGIVESLMQLCLGFLFLQSHRHRFRWENDAVQRLFKFGKWIFISTIVTFFAMESDKLLLGKATDQTILGVYSIAFKLAVFPNLFVDMLGAKILFPAFSRTIRESGLNKRHFYKCYSLIMFFSGAVAIFLVMSGDIIVESLYDSRYHEAGWMLSVLGIGGLFRSLQSPIRSILLAAGHSRDLAIGNFVKLFGMFLLLPLVTFTGNVVHIVLAFVVTDFIWFIFFAIIMSKKKIIMLKINAILLMNISVSLSAGCSLLYISRNYMNDINIYVGPVISVIVALIMFSGMLAKMTSWYSD